MKARDFWAADCETDPFKHGRIPKPFIFGAYNLATDEYFECETAEQFVEFFRHKRTIVYAHNGGRFDWHFILPYLEEQTEVMIVAGRFAKFKIGAAEFRDSYNLLPVPLAALNKMEFDYTLLEENIRHKHMEKIRAYLRSDCVNLANALQRFFDDYGRPLTLAGAAMKQWLKISGTKGEETTADFYAEIKPFYYGGRVQCFEKGIIKVPFKVFDIKSAYPKAMTYDHPCGDQYDDGNELPKTDDEIARCFITLDCASVGVFPFRDGNALEFPADHIIRRFEITGWEYLAARDTGMLGAHSRIVRVIRFYETVNFTLYINHFFALKEHAEKIGDKELRTFAKLFLNSLYGKWAANPGAYSEFLTVHPSEIDAHKKVLGYEVVNQFHNVALMSRDLPEEKQRFYNVAVGASITGWVRAYLWRALCKVKRPLYCDTDSIACIDGSALDLSGELGSWTFEGDFNRAAIGGKKLYAFRYSKPIVKGKEKITHKIASKGVKLSAKEIEAIAKGGEITYKPEAPTFGQRGIKFTARKVKMT